MKRQCGNEAVCSRTLHLFFLFFLLLFLAPCVALSQERLDLPSTNPNIQNPVETSLIWKIALKKTKDKWGSGVLGDPVPLSDINGNLYAYMFPYYFGGDSFPSHDNILARVKEGRELRNLIKANRIDEARNRYRTLKGQDTSLSISSAQEAPTVITPQGGLMPAVRPDGSISRRFQYGETEEMEGFARKRANGADVYGAIVVSATYDRTPVPVYYHSLPSYFTDFDLALKKAQTIVGPDAVLGRIYFQGILGQYLEFSGSKGRVLIHASSLAIKNENEFTAMKDSLLKRRQALTAADTEGLAKMREKIGAEWERIKSEVGK
jgi:hypothetical protein